MRAADMFYGLLASGLVASIVFLLLAAGFFGGVSNEVTISSAMATAAAGVGVAFGSAAVNESLVLGALTVGAAAAASAVLAVLLMFIMPGPLSEAVLALSIMFAAAAGEMKESFRGLAATAVLLLVALGFGIAMSAPAEAFWVAVRVLLYGCLGAAVGACLRERI